MDKKDMREKQKNKMKYKNKKYIKEKKETSTVDPQPSPCSEDIENNWSRYEVEDVNDSTHGENFETLIAAPISSDVYFKFKSEQNWDDDIKSQLQLNKYFTLNLKILNDGISCIPFNERHVIDNNLFSQFELVSMKKSSETNLQKYNKQRPRKESKHDEIIIKNKATSQTEKSQTVQSQKNIEVPKDVINKKVLVTEMKINVEKKLETIDTDFSDVSEENVDDLLNLQISEQNISVPDEPEIKVEDPLLLEKTELNKTNAPQIKVDLEQWLDDILDD